MVTSFVPGIYRALMIEGGGKTGKGLNKNISQNYSQRCKLPCDKQERGESGPRGGGVEREWECPGLLGMQ